MRKLGFIEAKCISVLAQQSSVSWVEMYCFMVLEHKSFKIKMLVGWSPIEEFCLHLYVVYHVCQVQTPAF